MDLFFMAKSSSFQYRSRLSTLLPTQCLGLFLLVFMYFTAGSEGHGMDTEDQSHLKKVRSEEAFEKAVSQESGCVVAFTVPWCGHCKKLQPELVGAAEDLKVLQIPMYSVDGDRMKKLSKKYSITGFPSVMIFKGPNNPTKYIGPRTREDIVKRVKKLLRPESEIIKEGSDLQDFLAKSQTSQVATYLILGNIDPVQKSIIEKIISSSALAAEMVLGHNMNPEQAYLEAVRVEKLPALVALYPGSSQSGFVLTDFRKKKIAQFIRQTMLPPIVTVDPSSTGLLLQSGLLPVFVFTSMEDDENQNLLKTIEQVVLEDFLLTHQLAHLDVDRFGNRTSETRIVDIFRVTSFPQIIVYNHSQKSFIRCQSDGNIESIRKCFHKQAISHFTSMDETEREQYLELIAIDSSDMEKLKNSLLDTGIFNDSEIEFVDNGFLASMKRKYPTIVYFISRPEFVLFSILPFTLILSYLFPGDKAESVQGGSNPAEKEEVGGKTSSKCSKNLEKQKEGVSKKND